MTTVDIRVLLADGVSPDDVTRGIVAGSLDGTTVLGATVLTEDAEWESLSQHTGAPPEMVPTRVFVRDTTVWDGVHDWVSEENRKFYLRHRVVDDHDDRSETT